MNDRQRQWLGAWLVFGGGLVFLGAVAVGIWAVADARTPVPDPPVTISTPMGV